jgi:hypothetical protein
VRALCTIFDSPWCSVCSRHLRIAAGCARLQLLVCVPVPCLCARRGDACLQQRLALLICCFASAASILFIIQWASVCVCDGWADSSSFGVCSVCACACVRVCCWVNGIAGFFLHVLAPLICLCRTRHTCTLHISSSSQVGDTMAGQMAANLATCHTSRLRGFWVAASWLAGWRFL